MKDWDFTVTDQAHQDIDNLDGSVRNRVLEKLRWMMDNFDKISPAPLSGKWKGFFKYKVGDYRIIYRIKEEEERVIIHYIGHRKSIYDR